MTFSNDFSKNWECGYGPIILEQFRVFLFVYWSYLSYFKDIRKIWEANSGLIIWDDLLIILTGISLALLFSRPLTSSDISSDENSER